MSHIFISYSRKDLVIAEKIINALAKDDLEPWIDWKSIPKGETFESEIQQGIEKAEIFLFLVSPDSIQSEWCNKEIVHAIKNGKRILPIVIRDTNPKIIHPEISKRNWIFCQDAQNDFNKAIVEIWETIHTDYAWLKYHTDLQIKALRWKEQMDNGRLLRGKDLRLAEEQLSSTGQKDPRPTDLQRQFVLESRRRESRTRNTVFTIGIIVMVALALLSVFAFEQRNTAIANQYVAQTEKANAEEQTRISNQQARLSRARELSVVSQSISDLYPIRRLLLAIEASNTLLPTDPKVLSLQSTLYASLAEMGGTVIARDDNGISRLAVSHDNKWLAHSSKSGTIVSLRNFSKPDKNTTLHLDSANVRSLVFSPNDQWLAAENGKNIRMWDITKTPSKSVDLEKHNDKVNTLAFTPNGHWLVSGSDDQTILMWNLKSQSFDPELLSAQTGSIVALNFSPNGRWLASINDGADSDNDIYLWDFEKEDAPVLTLRASCSSDGYGGYPILIMFSPDNRWLVTNCGGSAIRAQDTQNLGTDPVYMTDHSSPISALVFSPDGRWLVSGGLDETIRLWDIESPDKKSEILGGHKGSVNTLDFSTDGNFLVSGGSDALIKIWDMKWWPYRYRTSMTPVILRGHESSVTISVFSETSHLKDGSLLLISGGGDKTIRLWDVQKPSYIPTLVSDPLAKINQNSIRYLMFSSNGKWMASAGYFFAMESYPMDDILSLWDVKNMDKATIALNDIIVSPNPVEFSSDNHWLAYGSSASVRLVDLNESPAKYIELGKLESLVEVLAFDPGSQMLAAGDLNKNLKVYNINAPQEKPLVLNGDSVSPATFSFSPALSFSPDSKFLASGAGTSLLLLDLQNPENEPVKLKGHLIGVTKISFHGDWLASAGWDNHVNLWKMSNIEKGLIEPIILSHPKSTGGIYAMVFSHNGRWIASGSNDGSIYLWDLFNIDKPPLILEHELAVNSLSFSKDDQWLASGSDDGTARIWMVDSVIPSSAILQSGSVAIKSVDFSPDGKWLSIGSDDSLIKIWNVSMADALDNACRIAGRNFTRAEWGQYFPNDNYPLIQEEATCPQWLLDPIIAPTESP